MMKTIRLNTFYQMTLGVTMLLAASNVFAQVKIGLNPGSGKY